jgi:uncharacterized DUF497 family protein
VKLDFDWDEDKAKANAKKHKIGFEEAKTVSALRFCKLFPMKNIQTKNSDLLISGVRRRVKS